MESSLRHSQGACPKAPPLPPFLPAPSSPSPAPSLHPGCGPSALGARVRVY